MKPDSGEKCDLKTVKKGVREKHKSGLYFLLQQY
jgi:hypothetical protein